MSYELQPSGLNIPRAKILNPIEECSTLEAQEVDVKRKTIWSRHTEAKAKTSRQNLDISQDICSIQLRKAIDNAGPADREALVRLRKNYKKVRLSPAYPLCRDIFCFWTTEGQTENGVILSRTKDFNAADDVTFSRFLSDMAQHLLVASHGSLRTVILSAKSRTHQKHRNGFLKPGHKILSTFLGRLRSLPFIPNEVIGFLIADTLQTTRPPGFIDNSVPKLDDERRRSLLPPSLQVKRGNLDPDRLEDNHVHLSWLRKAPKFTADLDVYIWEQHKGLPAPQFADIRLYPCNDVDEVKMIITFQHTASMKAFINFRNNLSKYPRQSPASHQIWSANSEVFFSFASVFQVIVSETTKFLQESSMELEKLDVLARQNPSTDKIRYLIHLQDCHKLAHNSITHGIQVLDKILQWIDFQQSQQLLWDAGQSFSDRAQTLKLDMEHLSLQQIRLHEMNKSLQQIVREHLDLTHNRRNFIITFVAAIYLPLSLATSFFGMNMDPGVADGIFSDKVSQWIIGSPSNLQNATSALAATIETSSNLNYSWTTFIVTAVCLVISLPLSLTLGNIFRTIYQTTTIYAPYWRMAAAIPILAFIYFSIDLPWAEPPALRIVYWALNAVIIAFEVLMTFQAWRKNNKRIRWTTMLIVTVFFYAIDNTVNNIGKVPYMIFPWIGLGMYFLGRRYFSHEDAEARK